jgi:hypothetical protein
MADAAIAPPSGPQDVKANALGPGFERRRQGGSRPGGRGRFSYELLLVGALYVVLAGAVFAPHVAHGGLVYDDWRAAASYILGSEPRYASAVEDQQAFLGGRPLLARLLPLPFVWFGEDPQGHLGLAVALAVLAAITFYALLRALNMPRGPAAVVAGLGLLFPWADAVRLWPAAGFNQLALATYLGGATLAVLSLRLRGIKAIAGHGAALALYAMSLLIYEGTAGLIVATGGLYVWRGSWRAAWPRWLADILLVGPLLLWAHHADTAVRPTMNLEAIDPMRFMREGLVLGTRAIWPFGGPASVGLAVAGALVLVAGAGILHAGRARSDPEASRRRRVAIRWLVVALFAAIAAAIAWAPFAGSGLFPLAGGLSNRVNFASAFPLVLLTYALLAASFAAWFAPRIVFIAATSAAVLLGATYAVRVRNDIGDWNLATAQRRAELSAIKHAMPDPPPGGVLYVTGYPATVAPGVAVFWRWWDLTGAVQLLYRNKNVAGVPVVRGVGFVCGKGGLYPTDPTEVALRGTYGPGRGAPYGRAVLVDTVRGRATVVRDAAGCRAATARLRPAPFVGAPVGSQVAS